MRNLNFVAVRAIAVIRRLSGTAIRVTPIASHRGEPTMINVHPYGVMSFGRPNLPLTLVSSGSIYKIQFGAKVQFFYLIITKAVTL